ncbi:hypothetical protein D0T25_27295 [Duganella sp. BJB488]|uniref:hypothetical protein n=1 Tax=Duganella sp. BJB488 TaxID=1871350 RepID=UPI000E350D83|nr:hypothetical protein [Duganella sp. BJB488]RFP10967.1 hypothetical protein D0T26_26000 [Duganella sp. BJB489]RFP14484.1 hypothetical protein D0T25_27295 [Duganella sp. BJB488]RFP30420.1 hypothetical protein D0T24_27995 [Duganella sp. BJB480]
MENNPQTYLIKGAQQRQRYIGLEGRHFEDNARYLDNMIAAYDKEVGVGSDASHIPLAHGKKAKSFGGTASRTVVNTVEPDERIRAAILFIPFDANQGDGRTEGFRKHGAGTVTLVQRQDGTKEIVQSSIPELTEDIEAGNAPGWSRVTRIKQWEKSDKVKSNVKRLGFGTPTYKKKGGKEAIRTKIAGVGVARFCEYLLKDRLRRLGLFKGATFAQGLPRIVVLSENLFVGLDDNLADGWPASLKTDLGVEYRRIPVTGKAPTLQVQQMCAYQCCVPNLKTFAGVSVTAEWQGRKAKVQKKAAKDETWLILELTINGKTMRIGCVHLSADNVSLDPNAAEPVLKEVIKFAKKMCLDAILGDMNLNVSSYPGGMFPSLIEIAPDYARPSSAHDKDGEEEVKDGGSEENEENEESKESDDHATSSSSIPAASVASDTSSSLDTSASSSSGPGNPGADTDTLPATALKIGLQTSSGSGTQLYMGGLLIHERIEFGGTIINAGTASLPLYAKSLGTGVIDPTQKSWMQAEDAANHGDMQVDDEIYSDHPSIYADYILKVEATEQKSQFASTSSSSMPSIEESKEDGDEEDSDEEDGGEASDEESDEAYRQHISKKSKAEHGAITTATDYAGKSPGASDSDDVEQGEDDPMDG